LKMKKRELAGWGALVGGVAGYFGEGLAQKLSTRDLTPSTGRERK
jgi:hypothetical protein